LKKQIDDKRQREADEVARRRAEEEHEIAKHMEWQQQMERQLAEDAVKKQEKEAQERQQQQHLQEGLERQKQQDDIVARRSSISCLLIQVVQYRSVCLCFFLVKNRNERTNPQ
jgi:hypothetical protein